MATILTVGNSEGARRCDAHCHNAHEPECECVCGGRYHGHGLAAARGTLEEDILAGRLGEGLAKAAHEIRAGVQETLF